MPVTCATCGAASPRLIQTRRLWECRSAHPKRQFSAKVRTIFEDSPLPLTTWLPAVWLVANAKNGISSHELGRALVVTQKTAWFMLHRIRLAMKTGTFLKLSGKVEADGKDLLRKLVAVRRDEVARASDEYRRGKTRRRKDSG